MKLKDNVKKILSNNLQIIKFIIIGFSNLGISLLIYYILIFFKIDYQISNIFAFIFGSINGYFWNKKWVFKKNGDIKNTLVKFYITYLFTWLISSILLYVWIEIFKLSNLIAPILNLFITTPINYILNKKWVFINC